MATLLLLSIPLGGAASPAAAAGGTVYVNATWSGTVPGTDPDGGGPATNFGTDSFATITSALAVTPTRIELGPGTYVEQVVITSDVEIVGQGIGTTAIQAPAIVNDYHTRRGIVAVGNAAIAKLSNLTIKGPKVTAGGTVFAGIFVVESAVATFEDITVSTIRRDPLDGEQNGAGILIGDAPTNSNATAVLTRVTVTDYQKAGIIIRTGSTATISNSLVQGRGLTCVIAQNGIQIEGGATITSTQVLDHRYDNPPGGGPECGSGGQTPEDQVMSYGIRANNATGAVAISDSTIARNENNITINSPATPGATLAITNNTITGLNDVKVGRPFADTSAGIYTEWARPGATISGNTITATTWGIDSFADGGEAITSNTITSNTAAAQFKGSPGTFAANRIVGNTDGIIGTAGSGGPNWWGCNAGPSAVGCDTIAGAYTEPEWLVLKVAVPQCTVQVGKKVAAAVTINTTSAGVAFATYFAPPTTVNLTGSTQLSATPASGVTDHGALTATLTGTTVGNGTASAKADNATVTVPGDTSCAVATLIAPLAGPTKIFAVTAADVGPTDTLAVTGASSGGPLTLFALALLAVGALLVWRARKGVSIN